MEGAWYWQKNDDGYDSVANVSEQGHSDEDCSS